MINILIVTLILGSVAYVAWPVLNAGDGSIVLGHQGNGQMEGYLEKRDTLMATIKELEFDHQMGKLSDEDFAGLDSRYRKQALGILKQIDNAEPLAKKKKFDPENFCPKCGVDLSAADNFCTNCGLSL